MALLLITSSAVQGQQPNILLIISDDLGVDATNGYHTNNLMPTTPTLDSLAHNGITFENVWAYPMCTPTRSTIMSGKYGVKTGVSGVPGNLDLVHTSVFNQLKALPNSPYSGAVVGKWHISSPTNPNHPTEHGIDYYTGYISAAPAAYDNWERTYNGVTQTETGYVTTVLTDSAINWVDRQTKPWFLWLAHAAPHSPLHIPPSGLYTIGGTGTNLRKYFAMIEAMDYEINRLLSSMSEAERDNTIIIYMGDNGTPNNLLRDYPAGHGKSSLYQGGIRVPMFISGKGVTRKGVRESALISVNDIYATILELAGDTLEGGIYNSLSFKHLLDGTEGPTKKYNYIDFRDGNQNGWTVRNHQYKLIEFPLGGTQEMYDLIADSLEFNDLMLGTLTTEQEAIRADLAMEAASIRDGWSCRDSIMNGDEEGIDCGGSLCGPCNTMSIAHADAIETVSIYPNPSHAFITIETHGRFIQKIELLDLIGKRLLEVEPNGTFKATIDISSLKSNEYLIRVQMQEDTVFKRFSKQ